MINPNGSTTVVKEQIEDAVALAGYSAPTSWQDATDKINGTADQFERDQIADGMNGGLARDRINALFGGPVWAPEGAQLTIDFSANKAWTRGSGVTNAVDAVSLTRAGSATMLGPDGYQSFAAGELARIDGIGAQVAPARVNKCTNWNAAPTNLGSMTASGDGVLSLVDDVAGLTASGLIGICSGTVYKLDNTAGTTVSSTFFPGTAGNTNQHTVSIFGRSVLGNPQTRVRATGGALGSRPFVSGAVYERAVAAFTGVASGTVLGVDVAAGDTAYFILNQLEEGSYASPPIITSGAAVSRPGDILSDSVPDGGRAFVFEFDLLEPVVGLGGRRLIEFNDGQGIGTSSSRFRLILTSAGALYLEGNKAGEASVGIAGPQATLGRNIAYVVLGSSWASGLIGVGDGALGSRVLPEGITIAGMGCNGINTALSSFIYPKRFTERPVTDFATPADAFAWAKSIAQGWA